MNEYNSNPKKVIVYKDQKINSFISQNDQNYDQKTIASFGKEWNEFDKFDDSELNFIGNQYFDIVTDLHLNKNSYVLDVGCGTGRWSRYISSKVKFIEAVDPSDAIFNALEFNQDINNIRFSQAGVDCIPFENETFDFVFSLGVLHHIPNTEKAMRQCVEKIKIGGYFLVYLYYNLDNRGILYKLLFNITNFIRKLICKLPFFLKKNICNFLALTIYFPFAKFGLFFKIIFPRRSFYKKIPLYYYHDKSFYIMKNDSLDRFGTPLEQRFSKKQITEMMERSGLENIIFSTNTPFWHSIGKRYK